ncbi:MAG TPA: hypothetical protein VF659_00985 [Pyrinomonadaceae bacterium]|jgi:hypothetical protein
MPRKVIFCTPLLLLLLPAHAPAQAPAPTAEPTPRARKAADPGARAPKGEAAADPAEAQRRAQAVALLNTLAGEAAGFRDATLRARAQARAADALWATDAELARAMFRRAWDAADAADREAQRRMEEEMQAQLARGGAAMMASPPELRAEVLRLAARRDRALGEELLGLLSKAAREEAEGAAPKPPANGATRRADAGQRLGLAQRLLEEGDAERALQFAEPALTRADMLSVDFLSTLREKDAVTADRLYAALVARAEADPASDANTASALSSYVFTPFSFFTVTRGGGTGTGKTRGGVVPPPDVAPALRASLLRAVARILLRPQTAQEFERTSAGRTGTYVIIRRLLPLFERHAPDLTAALNARAAALLPDVPEGTRRAEAEGAFEQRQKADGAPERDAVREALDRAERTQGVDERDQIYASAAVNASWKGDPRAQELLDKINDAELARRVRKFADFASVRAALEKKDAEAAVARAKKGDLAPVERAWAYERAAELVAGADRARALSLLEEAAAEARRIDNADPDRARALLAVATRYALLDLARAWEFVAEAARAANSAPGFTGEDGKLVAQFRTKQGGWMTDFNVQEFDLADVLTALAADDWDRAVQLAQGFSGEAARVTAVVTLARAALTKKGR